MQRLIVPFAVIVLAGVLISVSPAQATIGTGSCETGIDVCLGNTGDVGDNSCNGDNACVNNTLDIGAHQCNGDGAC